MKKWLKPEVQNLALGDTKTDGCPQLGENGTVTFTPMPNGSKPCNWWKVDGCTHKHYGKDSTTWPCPKSSIEDSTGGSTEGLMS